MPLDWEGGCVGGGESARVREREIKTWSENGCRRTRQQKAEDTRQKHKRQNKASCKQQAERPAQGARQDGGRHGDHTKSLHCCRLGFLHRRSRN